MNDIELDEMLNQWDTPPAPSSLGQKVRAGLAITPKRERRRLFPSIGWKGLFAGVAAAAVVFLAVLAQAFPQVLGSPSPALRPPYEAFSKETSYAEDGSSRLDWRIMSYAYKGTEMVQVETDPGNPLLQAIKEFHLGIHLILLHYLPNLVLPESSSKDAWFSSYVTSGCTNKGDVLIGHETVLSYRTNVVQSVFQDGSRWTGWMAPDLGCFALKSRIEKPLPGGGYRIQKQRETVAVQTRRSDGRGWQFAAGNMDSIRDWFR